MLSFSEFISEGLGSNKDYKTWERKVNNSLAKHAARVEELVASGMDREQASKKAYEEMTKSRSSKKV